MLVADKVCVAFEMKVELEIKSSDDKNCEKMMHILLNHGLWSDLNYCECLRCLAAGWTAAYYVDTRCQLFVYWAGLKKLGTHINNQGGFIG